MKFRPILLLVLVLPSLTGRNDHFDKGYSTGCSDGLTAREKVGLEKAEQEHAAVLQAAQPDTTYTYTTTEVCGGGGVSLGVHEYSDFLVKFTGIIFSALSGNRSG